MPVISAPFTATLLFVTLFRAVRGCDSVVVVVHGCNGDRTDGGDRPMIVVMVIIGDDGDVQ